DYSRATLCCNHRRARENAHPAPPPHPRVGKRDTSAVKTMSEQPVETRQGAANYVEGDVLGGRYKITEKIGRGGFATVYRGVQLNLDQPVAIKVLDNRSDRPEIFVERFLREAKTATQVRHPDIVKV